MLAGRVLKHAPDRQRTLKDLALLVVVITAIKDAALSS